MLIHVLSSCIGNTALCREVGWRCTIAVSAWCSTDQLPGYECAMNRSHATLRRQNDVYMGTYIRIKPYIQAFTYTYKLKTYIYIPLHLLHAYLYLNASIYGDICIYRCILACIWSCHILNNPKMLGFNSLSSISTKIPLELILV